MIDNQSFFSERKIKKHLYSLNSVKEKIDYLNSQLKIFKEIYSHNNDEEIEEYIKKHKISSLVYKGTILHKRDDTIIDYYNFMFSILNYISTRFKNFQYQILLLIKYVEKELSDLVFMESVFDDNFNICFDKDELFKIMRTFDDDDYSALEWIEKEYKKIHDIINHYSFELFEKLQIKYKVSQYVFVKDNKVVINRSTYPQSSVFKDRLQKVLIPAIEYFIDELDFKITLHSAFYRYPDQFEDIDDKFPLFKYDFHYANSYCESVFKLIEEKIEYFSYIILSYNLTHKQDSSNAEKNNSVLFPFEQKLAHLKTVYELKRNKEIPAPPSVNIDTTNLVDGIKQAIEPLTKQDSLTPIIKSIPKSKQDALLIKQYFKIALEAEDVPKLTQLETKEFSVPFWSKKFLDIFFITKLQKNLESKIKSGKINDKNRDLYTKLRDDIVSKIQKATKAERNKTGSKKSNSKSVDERFIDEDSYDKNDYYDKSPDD